MTLWAILSDVHANREALDACLRDAEEQGAEQIAILGDVVDYGPDPVYCIERSTEVADVLLVGNHEQATVEPDEYAEPSEVMEWSLEALAESNVWRDLQDEVREKGAEKLASRVVGDMHFVHASAGRPTIQYVWPGHEIQYVQYNHHIDDRLSEFLDEFQTVLGFNGHTHVPAVMTSYQHREVFDAYKGVRRHHVHTFIGPRMIFFVPSEPCVIRDIGGRKMAINVGSVGQPRRLGDNRASYVLTDGEDMEFRRVEYPWQRTAEKLEALPTGGEEKAELIERLRSGI